MEQRTAEHVKIGSTVTVRISGQPARVFKIAGESHDAAPERGVISLSSPLGKCIEGHTAGERIAYKVRSADYEIEITEVVNMN